MKNQQISFFHTEARGGVYWNKNSNEKKRTTVGLLFSNVKKIGIQILFG